MKTNKFFFLSSLIMLLNSIIVYTEGDDKNKIVNKSSDYNSYIHFNINNISTWVYNDGTADININGNSGFEFPKGSGKAAIFQSGFLWGGKIDGQIRVGGSAYRSGLKPGRILNSGVPWYQLQAENPNNPLVRIYRVRPDYSVSDLSSEVNDGEGTEEQIRALYEKDWNEWPAQFGAPYTDLDDNGVYNPSIDVPGVPGADQTIWYVANDIDSNQTKFLYGSLPIGIEMQVTIWGYNTDDPLNNIMFRKNKFINKSDTEYTDVYVSPWNDSEIGDGSDDYVGCDTLLNLGFGYNALETDNAYGRGLASAGFKLLQGPIVDGLPSDSAIFNGRIIYGKKNLSMTSYYFYIGPDAVYRDPAQGVYTGTLEFYNFLQGKIGITGEYFPVPPQFGGGTTHYPLSGDPISNQGWIDGIIHPRGDRRYGISSGPFNFAPADTQEVVYAQVAAGGEGVISRLTALSWMKYYSLFADIMYKTFFQGSIKPPKPQVTAAELDRQIVLNWGNNINSAKEIEKFNTGGFFFQGYNVYQLASKDTPIEDAVKIATFDIIDNVKTIVDYDIDPITGALITSVKQHGNDTGIERFLSIKKDSLRNEPLNNGSVYYFGVTSYTYNSTGIRPNNFESEPSVIKVVPQSTPPGVRYEGKYGDKIEVVHEQGKSDGIIDAEVIDPGNLTGHSYQITFNNVDDITIWKLINITLGVEIFSEEVQLISEANYYIIDGMKLNVADSPPGIKSEDIFSHPDESELWGWEIISGTRRFTWANADGFHFEGFRGAIGYANPYSFFNNIPNPVSPVYLKKVLLKFGSVPDGSIQFENPAINPNVPSSDPNFSYAYRYGRAFHLPPAKPEFIPYIINADDGYSFQDFKKNVPLSVWDVDDPSNPRRLAIGFTENNSDNGLLDGRYFPGDFNFYNNTSEEGPREWLFIFDAAYSELPNPELQVDILSNPVPILYWFTVNRRGPVPFSPGSTGEDQMVIHPNKVFIPDDIYSFTAPGIFSSKSLAKEDVQKINVFPNPYYAGSTQEASKHETFVKFNHLPQRAVIRIFNLAGQLVRTIHKNSSDQFEIWDLQNDHGLPASSGVFIVYIDMPDLQATKILKLAIVQRVLVPDYY
jgi:hypothetical protein